MALSLEQFQKRLADSGLLSAAELSQFVDALPVKDKPADSQQLARILVRARKLTAYQAQEVYRGAGKGLVLGNYVILDKLGQGGMGMVLKAEHKRMHRLVALKVLSPDAVKSQEAVQRFHREVEAAARLEHTNIVTAYDADEAGGTHFFVMQYVEGSDLSSLVKSEGPLAVNKAVNCVLQAARGLEYAHQHGVVHRDIKPANLLLNNDGVVKILDMGLARVESAASAGNADLTGTGQIMGTIDYMAPEQALNTKYADERSDMYSLGMTLWFLLTGKAAYGGDSLMEKLLAHREQPLPSLLDQRRDVPEALDAVFQKMIAKQPADRYQTMAEAVAALAPFVAQDGGATIFTGDRPKAEDAKLSDFLRQQPSAPGRAEKTQIGTDQFAVTAQMAKTAVSHEATLAVTQNSADTNVGVSASAGEAGSACRAEQSPARQAAPVQARLPAKAEATSKLVIGGAVGAAVLLIALPLGIWLLTRGGEKHKGQGTKGPISQGGPPQVKAATDNAAPPPAIAPFDAKQARSHQDVWATHLGTTVETTNSVGAKMILIPPGEFQMGSTDEQVAAALKAAERMVVSENEKDRLQKSERPQHRVVITRPFRMGATEVTVGQFKNFSATGYQTEAEKAGDAKTFLDPAYALTDDMPASLITWNDATAYCKWLSEQEQVTYRLPTEAEWEYACRAGTTTMYSFGDDAARLTEFAWFNKNAGFKPHPVGTKPANSFGLHDMHGNLYEWCQDNYGENWYQKSPTNDPLENSLPRGSARVIRGGHWYFSAFHGRSAARSNYPPSLRSHHHNGFRVVRELGNVPSTGGQRPALQFAGTTSYVELPPTLVKQGSALTLETRLLNEDLEIRFNLREGENRLHLMRQAGGELFWLRPDAAGKAPGPLAQLQVTKGSYSHFAAVDDGQTLSLFVDGQRPVARNIVNNMPNLRNWPSFVGYFANRASDAHIPGGTVLALRVSKTARYTSPFTPPKIFEADADTLALYHFDEGSGEVLNDSSGHKHHGKIVNAKWVQVAENTGEPWQVLTSRGLSQWNSDSTEWQEVGSVKLDPQDRKRLQSEPGQGVLLCVSKARGARNLTSKAVFGDLEVKGEFMIPAETNSGVFFLGHYEFQIWDSRDAKRLLQLTDCGGVFTCGPDGKPLPEFGAAPQMNAAGFPGEWQSFEAVFRAPKLDGNGKLLAPGRFERVLLNQQVVQRNVDVKSAETISVPRPLMLQGGFGDVAFRNLQVRPLPSQP